MSDSLKRVKIILHGHLKNLYSEQIELTGSNVAEIINGLCTQTKAFNPKLGEDRHCISIKGFNTSQSLTDPIPDHVTELHITPALIGGKNGGFFQIVLGTVLVATTLLTAGAATVGVAAAIEAMGTLATIGFNLGISMIIGGLISVISPSPKMDSGSSSNDPEASKYLGATSGNTVRIGTRIPLIYGRMKHYGHYISFNVDSKDVAL